MCVHTECTFLYWILTWRWFIETETCSQETDVLMLCQDRNKPLYWIVDNTAGWLLLKKVYFGPKTLWHCACVVYLCVSSDILTTDWRTGFLKNVAPDSVLVFSSTFWRRLYQILKVGCWPSSEWCEVIGRMGVHWENTEPQGPFCYYFCLCVCVCVCVFVRARACRTANNTQAAICWAEIH